MAGNTFGRAFALTTFGESHGAALGAVVDGCPPGLALCEADLQRDLDRRRPGQSKYTTQRREPDQVRILSGIFEGVTTGTAIGMVIDNVDQRSRDYGKIKDQFRPAHADFTYHAKYGVRDYRGGGRASARETAMRVAAGAIARKYLAEQAGVTIRGYLAQIGDREIEAVDLTAIDQNPFFCADPNRVDEIAAVIDALRREGDSIGAKVTVVASGVPPGLGEPVFGKLDAELAAALMGINAVKAWSWALDSHPSPSAAASTATSATAAASSPTTPAACSAAFPLARDIVASIALKPTSSITKPGRGVDRHGNEVAVVTTGRHDPCVGIRAVPSPKRWWRWC